MNRPDAPVLVAARQDVAAVMESATIWARAKAHRDQEPQPSNIEEAKQGIQRRLSIEGASLLLAQRDGRTVGFAIVAPRLRTLEVFYLAVAPEAWGYGVATQLLHEVETHARAAGRGTLELWVIDDNERAIGLYENMLWISTEQTQHDPHSGRTERRFLRHIR